MIEKNIEAKLMTKLATLTALADVEIVGSRQAASAGFVKGEQDTSKKAVVAVSIGARQFDDFSLPTVNLKGSVALMTRAEFDPTQANHAAFIDALVTLFATWHNDGALFSQEITTSDFFAAELRMDGGNGTTFESNQKAWTESFDFTIRGTPTTSQTTTETNE